MEKGLESMESTTLWLYVVVLVVGFLNYALLLCHKFGICNYKSYLRRFQFVNKKRLASLSCACTAQGKNYMKGPLCS